MKLEWDRPSILFDTRVARMVGITLVFAAAWAAGTLEGVHRFGGLAEMTVESPATVIGNVSVKAAEPAADAVDDLAAWDLPNLDHPRVDYWIRRFTTDKRGEFERFLSRSSRYVPLISAKLEERGMPRDLVYLAMIESGFNPRAYSKAHASGIWQFIAETGRRYGLDINRAVDERNDPVKATDAALDYLTYLHDRFGSWYLAAAGYNTGENRVGRIMREVTGSERGDEKSYYRIWSRLPKETRDYVPLMIAAARIAKNPEKYGFGDVEWEDPLKFDEVTVDPATPLAAVAEAAGTTVAVLKQLNPHFKLERTRNDMRSIVRVPSGGAKSFAANWSRVKRSETYARESASAASERYRVRRGDNLTVIARRYGVSIRAIREANGLRSDRIRAGAVLRIPA